MFFFFLQQNRTSALQSNGFFRPCNNQLSLWFSMRIPKLVPLIAKGRKKNTLALDVIVKKLTPGHCTKNFTPVLP